jgi:hypothetical protein
VLFVMELLQSLGKAHANERRQPRRNPSQQRKIDVPSHTASAWQAIDDSRDTDRHARDPWTTQPYPEMSSTHSTPACALTGAPSLVTRDLQTHSNGIDEVVAY